MNKGLRAFGIVLLLVQAASTRVPADPTIKLSFGRIVYGAMGVVLPKEAWLGDVADSMYDGTSPIIDADGNVRYESWLLTGFYDYTSIENGTLVVNASLVPSGTLTTEYDTSLVVGALLFSSDTGWESTISLYQVFSTATLVPIIDPHTEAGYIHLVHVGTPFAFAYSTALPGGGASSSYSADPWLNTGFLPGIENIRIYTVDSGICTGMGFVGFEPGRTSASIGGWNDSVVAFDYLPIPEPAFYQMGGLLFLGALGMLRITYRARR
jgi:hypothetical protein